MNGPSYEKIIESALKNEKQKENRVQGMINWLPVIFSMNSVFYLTH